MRLALLPIALLALAGCRNDCQKLCVAMSDYASECGYEVSKDELKACISDHANKTTPKTERDVCAEEAPALREEWTCDEIARYFQEAQTGDDTGG